MQQIIVGKRAQAVRLFFGNLVALGTFRLWQAIYSIFNVNVYNPCGSTTSAIQSSTDCVGGKPIL